MTKRYIMHTMAAVGFLAVLSGAAQADDARWSLGEAGLTAPTLMNAGVNPLAPAMPAQPSFQGHTPNVAAHTSLWYLESLGLTEPTLRNASINPFYVGAPNHLGDGGVSYEGSTGELSIDDPSLHNAEVNPLY